MCAALVAPHKQVAASRANFNTEIGLPVELLSAPRDTEVLVLELAMRGFGQIAELTAICEPDVGVVTNIGPVHLEQMKSLEGVARAKGELLAGLRDGAVAVVPAGETLLDPVLRPALQTVTFGPGGDVDFDGDAVVAGGERLSLELPFTAAHLRRNLLAAVAAVRAVGVRPSGRVDVRFSALRGERVVLGTGAVVINDCYNANPLSMRAALDDLALQEPAGRRVAVLGDMLELGAEEAEHHRSIGAHAATAGVDLLVAVGPRAAAMADAFGGESRSVADAGAAATLTRELVRPGDLILVKGSRGVGLEVVAEAFQAGADG
jgi:UDP-N-acetylmuramoyl-tripeptide--D-alanyl-D-alanine ligase